MTNQKLRVICLHAYRGLRFCGRVRPTAGERIEAGRVPWTQDILDLLARVRELREAGWHAEAGLLDREAASSIRVHQARALDRIVEARLNEEPAEAARLLEGAR